MQSGAGDAPSPALLPGLHAADGAEAADGDAPSPAAVPVAVARAAPAAPAAPELTAEEELLSLFAAPPQLSAALLSRADRCGLGGEGRGLARLPATGAVSFLHLLQRLFPGHRTAVARRRGRRGLPRMLAGGADDDRPLGP
eukprot:gene48699-28973_t